MKYILQLSYWEHFKAAKELALVLPVEHPRRQELDRTMNELLAKIKVIDGKG